MASYHCSIKPVGRRDGRTSIAAVAYRAGVKLTDERTGDIHDYSHKRGIAHSELVLPTGVILSRSQLWNTAEQSEKRKDARVAREFELALPEELTPEQRKELALEYAKHIVKLYVVAADVNIHAPNRKGDQRNHHAHILVTTRRITPNGLGDKTDLEREDKALRAEGKRPGREQMEALRATWADMANQALVRAGHASVRISHKSLKAQGIDRLPTVHLGPTASAMERRGVRTERGDINRGLQEANVAKAELAVLERESRLEQAEAEVSAKTERKVDVLRDLIGITDTKLDFSPPVKKPESIVAQSKPVILMEPSSPSVAPVRQRLSHKEYRAIVAEMKARITAVVQEIPSYTEYRHQYPVWTLEKQVEDIYSTRVVQTGKKYAETKPHAEAFDETMSELLAQRDIELAAQVAKEQPKQVEQQPKLQEQERSVPSQHKDKGMSR